MNDKITLSVYDRDSLIKNSVKNIEEALIDGRISVRETAAIIAFLPKMAKSLRENEEITREIIKFAEQHGGTYQEESGFKITASQNAEYDYQSTKRWLEIKNEEAKLSRERKEIEDIAKKIKVPSPHIDSNGEEIIINPANVKRKDVFRVSSIKT